MSRLRLKPAAETGRVHNVTPESAGWAYVGFELFKLEPGERAGAWTGHREVCLVLVSGKARVEAGESDFGEIGERMSETLLEETYYHRLNPPQGFAFQRVYTDDRSLDEAMAVEDGDVALVPRGYHPVATVHGYDLYYLNVMAGPKRAWRFYNAPEHEWLLR
jgi:5-deoxy-D-glucuronate isomerase